MAAIKTAISDALECLLEGDFKKFKWHLSNESWIPEGKLEKADRQDVVDLLVQRFSADAGTKAVQALRKINQNDRADHLERKLQEGVSGEVSAPGAASSSRAANAPPAPASGVSVNISSSGGGSVKAPVLHGGVFNGPVTFN